MNHTIQIPLLLAALCFSSVDTLVADEPLILSNDFLEGKWMHDDGRIIAVAFTDKNTRKALQLKTGHLPRIVLDDGRAIDLTALAPVVPVRREDSALVAGFKDDTSGLHIQWSVALEDGAHYVIQSLQLTASQDTTIKELIFVDTGIDGAKQIGRVDGSVVVTEPFFLAVEHPLAKNTVDTSSRVRCALPRGNILKAGRSWRYTSVLGVVEKNQLRRGFLAYLEQRRAHRYRPFLHYNSWYHLNIGRPDNHMTEAECLATIEHFGRELIKKRGVKMDAFVWDDGWDDFDSLWKFHEDFPDGFKKLRKTGVEYGAAQGVWMSPWGGYGGPKKKRVAHGKSKGYETNRHGFSMAGPKYRGAFRDVCLEMMRHHGVVFFKFDGMGVGGGTGAEGDLADDVDAVLDLTRELRKEDPDLFISATVGTWASPFWTLYADSVWRQGGDTGFHGAGNGRQQWITYRDMFCHRCIVQWGPLYPLNSLMLHGPCIGERTNPAKMDRDEKSVADEFWTFFGSGTNLQELYISPHLLTSTMWDALATAAKWSRDNADVLVDTHWIGGDPGIGEVYGWASWSPRKGIVVLRNPADKPATYELDLAHALELPQKYLKDYRLTSPRPGQRLGGFVTAAATPYRLELQPFEVLVFETAAVAGAGKLDAESNAGSAMAAAVKFADTVLEYGRDTHGKKQAPLFVDGLNVDTMKPPERVPSWSGGEGMQPWISSNLADQGNLMRFLVGLSNLTGEPKYKQAAVDAVKYNFDHFQGPSGLLPMGHHRFIELKRDAYHGDVGKGGCPHELKGNFLDYEFLWEIDPVATRRMIEGIWNAHVRNWSNLEFNRHAGYSRELPENVWDRTFDERNRAGLRSGSQLSFYDTATDMILAAGMLSKLGGDARPLIWAERLLGRYVHSAHPKTGLIPYQHIQSGNRPARQSFPANATEPTMLIAYANGNIRPPDVMFAHGATAMLRLGEALGKRGEFIRTSVSKYLAAYARNAYDEETNTFRPMLCDGTDLTGFVIPKDGYFGSKGTTLTPWKAHAGYLLSYSLCFRLSRAPEIWHTLRAMARGNELGDIGNDTTTAPRLDFKTTQDDPHAIFALIELYSATENKAFLELAHVIATNMLSQRFMRDKGLFVLDRNHLIANLDSPVPLALITLVAGTRGELDKVPTYDGGGHYAWGRTAVLSGHSVPVPGVTNFEVLRPGPDVKNQ